MLLAFDIGNSRTKIGLYNRNKLVFLISFDTHCTRYPATCKAILQDLLQHNGISRKYIASTLLLLLFRHAQQKLKMFVLPCSRNIRSLFLQN